MTWSSLFQGQSHLGDTTGHPFELKTQFSGHFQHSFVFGEYRTINLFQAFLLSDAYDQINELITQAFALVVIMHQYGVFAASEVRFDNQSPDTDYSSASPFLPFSHNSHLPVIIDIAEADKHFVGDIIDD